MMSAKIATSRLLKMKFFGNKGHDVTKKMLLRDSNYIADVVMCPKFPNSSISMREVIITSFL